MMMCLAEIISDVYFESTLYCRRTWVNFFSSITLESSRCCPVKYCKFLWATVAYVARLNSVFNLRLRPHFFLMTNSMQ